MPIFAGYATYTLMHSDSQKLYGLLGFPLGHSFSQNFFNSKFDVENINARYVNFEIPTIEDFQKVIASNPNLCGLNVTIPYKEQVMPFLDEIDEAAARIGAVNVIKLVRTSGRIALIGYNSDVIGFVESIRPMLRPGHKRALVLGTGGASKAVAHGLRALGIEPRMVSRRAGADTLAYSDLTPEVMEEHKVVVNATPLGMYPHVDACPPIPYDCLDDRSLCYDVVYNPAVTKFMLESAKRGAVVKNGLEMLHLQALAAWDIWNSPDNTSQH